MKCWDQQGSLSERTRSYHYSYPVRLSKEQRNFLETMVQTSRTPAKHYLNELKPWLKKSWCFPKEESGEFVWHTEDVLDVYCQPYDPSIPRICMDEMGKNLVKDKYPPKPAKPGQAKALADRLEIHYTPKHASWLNIAEIELSVLARQGLAHHIATIEDLCQQVQQWQDHRNQRVGTVNWQFRTADARIKLKRLYPVQQPDSQSPGHVV
jgi:DDE superfamily endonuclease